MNPLYLRVYKRDNWQCRACRGGPLHPHHVKYRSHCGPDIETNLLTLCNQCHAAVHRGDLWIFVVSTGERATGSNLINTEEKLRFMRRNGWRPQ